MKILKLPSFYSGNFKIFKNALGQLIPKNALGQLIPNRPLKRTVTSTNGTMKTLLHVTIGQTVHKISRSKQLTQILYRLGICMIYDKI